jgi:hypothetical protein
MSAFQEQEQNNNNNNNNNNNQSIFPREKIIQDASLTFHTGPYPSITDEPEKPPQVFQLFPEDSNMSFGILNVTIADTPMLTQELVLDVSSDISGSMNDECPDGRTKSKHAINAIQNIITAISKKTEANVIISTYGFDEKVVQVITDTKITQENADALRAMLTQLQPRGSTDIYKSLEMQKQRAQKRGSAATQTNITLTDGQANVGKSTDYSVMSEQVAPNCTNVFIGFGNDHNASGLQQLANAQPNGSYFYIAEIEKGPIVFGEIIHQLIYTALTNITIQATNAEIYDYKTNTWKTEIHISSLVSEATKTYHVRCIAPESAIISISACSAIHEETIPTEIETDILAVPDLQEADGTIVANSLGLYMLRQRTQELLFKAHENSLAKEKRYLENYEVRVALGEKEFQIKKEMKEHYTFMKKYAVQEKLEADELLSSLITDIAVVLQTFGGAKATMYSGARGDSQGRQTSNNVSQINPEDVADGYAPLKRQRHARFTSSAAGGSRGGGDGYCPAFLRQGAVADNNGDGDKDEDEDDLSNFAQPVLMTALSRSNTTPKQKELMRDLSMGVNTIDELEEDA